MRLEEVRVEGVRTLRECRLSFNGDGALVWGANGAGKTSLLEAIHVLAAGRSFRTRNLELLVGRDLASLSIFGVVNNLTGRHRLGVVKERGAATRAALDGKPAGALSSLADQLAVRAITPESHELVSGGPAVRRALVDWALFHVEHRYRDTWRRYERILRQRNAALRSGAPTAGWDEQLALAGQEVTEARTAHVEAFSSHFSKAAALLLPELPVELALKRGWSEKHASLASALASSRSRDTSLGYSSIGSHRDDLEIKVDGRRATELLSRGQEKLVACALVLAQVRWLTGERGEPPIVLGDDLPSELDAEKRGALLDALSETGAQMVLTSLDADALTLPKTMRPRVFHVKHGRFTEMV